MYPSKIFHGDFLIKLANFLHCTLYMYIHRLTNNSNHTNNVCTFQGGLIGDFIPYRLVGMKDIWNVNRNESIKINETKAF